MQIGSLLAAGAWFIACLAVRMVVCTVRGEGQAGYGRLARGIGRQKLAGESQKSAKRRLWPVPPVDPPEPDDSRSRRLLRRLLGHVTWKRAILFIIVLGMIPALLGILYRLEFVRPVSTLMLARWATFQPVERQWVELENVAPIMVYSVIMSEDGQFCAHRGIDLKELGAVIGNALDGEKTRGASTIPMQTAKNLFLWTGRSYVRKALEIPLAVYIDGLWPKKRIMEVYLNIAEWDEGVFGVEAAAQHYFSRSASKLTARQAALLTVSLPDPKGRNPARPSGSLQRLAGVIQRRAAKSGGYIQCVK